MDTIPSTQFAKDHYSVLGYIESHMVDHKGAFFVTSDVHMRTTANRFGLYLKVGQVIMDPKYSTVLADGSVVQNHDDWSCLNDMIACGWFSIGYEKPDEALNIPLTSIQQILDEDNPLDLAESIRGCYEGLILEDGPTECVEGATVRITELGIQMAQQLRSHKIAGGIFGNFAPQMTETNN